MNSQPFPSKEGKIKVKSEGVAAFMKAASDNYKKIESTREATLKEGDENRRKYCCRAEKGGQKSILQNPVVGTASFVFIVQQLIILLYC